MQSKFNICLLSIVVIGTIFMNSAFSETESYEDSVIEDIMVNDSVSEDAEKASAKGITMYDINGTLFEQITSLEQEKILMQLAKEREQLNLDLDKLANEKMKLQIEMEQLSGRVEQQKQELELEKAKLENEAAKLQSEREHLSKGNIIVETNNMNKEDIIIPEYDISKNYKLVNVIGVGNQLEATLENLNTGQSKRVSVGKTIDGYTIRSISLNEGVVFVGENDVQTLNISKIK